MTQLPQQTDMYSSAKLVRRVFGCNHYIWVAPRKPAVTSSTSHWIPEQHTKRRDIQTDIKAAIPPLQRLTLQKMIICGGFVALLTTLPWEFTWYTGFLQMFYFSVLSHWQWRDSNTSSIHILFVCSVTTQYFRTMTNSNYKPVQARRQECYYPSHSHTSHLNIKEARMYSTCNNWDPYSNSRGVLQKFIFIPCSKLK